MATMTYGWWLGGVGGSLTLTSARFQYYTGRNSGVVHLAPYDDPGPMLCGVKLRDRKRQAGVFYMLEQGLCPKCEARRDLLRALEAMTE